MTDPENCISLEPSAHFKEQNEACEQEPFSSNLGFE
jgi:hypothetical protein